MKENMPLSTQDNLTPRTASYLPLPDCVALCPAYPKNGSTQEQTEIETLLHAQETKRTKEGMQSYRYWRESAVILWNEIACETVSEYDTQPPLAARVYALVSVAQHDALLTVHKMQTRPVRRSPSEAIVQLKPLQFSNAPYSYPSVTAAIASASAEVLSGIYPRKRRYFEQLARQHQEICIMAGANWSSDLVAGSAIGRSVGKNLLHYAAYDKSNKAKQSIHQPKGRGFWEGTAPILPSWGNVRLWFSNDAPVSIKPPPDYESPEFRSALYEVRHTVETLTEDNLRCAKRWALGAGTITPTGIWNYHACQLIKRHQLNPLSSARILALLNTAMMDASIFCWQTKYRYWLVRPSQADPDIDPPVGLPNFPSYPSGHSTFSGAAATVLSHFFPKEATDLWSKANEASLSRLYGGIHYRFDCDKGLELGKRIAENALAQITSKI